MTDEQIKRLRARLEKEHDEGLREKRAADLVRLEDALEKAKHDLVDASKPQVFQSQLASVMSIAPGPARDRMLKELGERFGHKD